MLLVEQDFIERLKNNETLSENSTSSRLDSEMQKIIKSKLDDREKWTLYSQALQRFLHFAELDRKPFKIPIVMDGVEHFNNDNNGSNLKKEENIGNDSVANPTSPEGDVAVTPSPDRTNQDYPIQFTPSHIVQGIPKSYRQKTQALMDVILLHKKKIWWKTGGEVVLNNRTIPNSNIVDLVNDVIRPLKREKPIGWEEFALVLNDINVPTFCIGNPANSTFIKQVKINKLRASTSTLNTRDSSFEVKTASTPIPAKPLKSGKKKLDWERWSPY